MAVRAVPCILLATFALAGCAFGPRLQSAYPKVREVPVLANLSPAESLARARSFLASRQYGLAIELYRAAAHDPALEIEGLNGLAIAYDGIGRSDLAERYFQKALALRTDDERTRRNLATFYSASGQNEKRLALLADVTATPAKSAIVAPATPAAGLASSTDQIADTDAPAMADLRGRSPLGAAFYPLLVQAGLPGQAAPVAMASSHDVSVVCLAGDPAAELRHEGDAAKMFRVSIGEVFIITEPDGTSCALASPAAKAPGGQQVSNKEYLGLVAAYLEQLDWWQRFAGLASPTPGVS